MISSEFRLNVNQLCKAIVKMSKNELKINLCINRNIDGSECKGYISKKKYFEKIQFKKIPQNFALLLNTKQ